MFFTKQRCFTGTVYELAALLPLRGDSKMVDEQGRPPAATDGFVVRRLVKESGITEKQARELITFLGYDWASLMREARILAGKL
jgi:hypothetical protein